jgi:cation transport regulator
VIKEVIMPYRTSADLPPRVRHVLPPHAQSIYRTVFNNAWQEYADASKRRSRGSQEETAHRVAWAAVKAKYEKADGRWVAKD